MRLPLLPGRERPLFFAHRGCSSLAPENTMPAFSLARSLGAPGLELDIHPCKGGELVVAHDYTLSRVIPRDDPCRGRPIESLSLREVRDADVGAAFGKAFAGAHPPLLSEVIEEFAPGLYIDIELKSEKASGDPLPALTAREVLRFSERVRESLVVSSFNPFALRAFKRLCPQVATAIIWCDAPEVPLVLRRGAGSWLSRCDYLKPRHDQAPRRARKGHQAALPVVPWTVDDAALARALLEGGCAGLISNRPQDILPVLAAWREERRDAPH
jgi:glycerophosphoryl diester phosphodiesterase